MAALVIGTLTIAVGLLSLVSKLHNRAQRSVNSYVGIVDNARRDDDAMLAPLQLFAAGRQRGVVGLR